MKSSFRIRVLSIAVAFGLLMGSATPAYAMKNRTIVLRAAGSGALLGLGAGLISYPFAKSKNTVFAGIVVGALLGVVYGYYLIDTRNDHYLHSALEPRRDRPEFSSLSEVMRSRSPASGDKYDAENILFPLPELRF